MTYLHISAGMLHKGIGSHGQEPEKYWVLHIVWQVEHNCANGKKCDLNVL